MMGIMGKLQAVQTELKAPKGQFNSFGKYKYRSCEDILEAVKPVLAKHGAAVTVGDEIIQIGERYYIKATAKFYDTESDAAPIENTAWAREPDDKRGMDASQITGTASSYARKYALNGLFLIDDTKDADTDEHHNQTSAKPAKESASARIAKLKMEMERTGIGLNSILSKYGIKPEGDSVEKNLARLTEEQYENAMQTFKKTPDKA